jgi:hypothetical protein
MKEKGSERCFRLGRGCVTAIDNFAARQNIPRARALQIALTYSYISGNSEYFRPPKNWAFVGSYLARGQLILTVIATDRRAPSRAFRWR